MKRRKTILKGVALLCSVTLASCLVAYRAGAFDRNPPAADTLAVEPVLPSTKSFVLPEEDDAEFMGSSKSDDVFTPDPGDQQANPSNRGAESESGEGGKADTAVLRLSPEDIEFMGSSKSAPVFHKLKPVIEQQPANGTIQDSPKANNAPVRPK